MSHGAHRREACDIALAFAISVSILKLSHRQPLETCLRGTHINVKPINMGTQMRGTDNG